MKIKHQRVDKSSVALIFGRIFKTQAFFRNFGSVEDCRLPFPQQHVLGNCFA